MHGVGGSRSIQRIRVFDGMYRQKVDRGGEKMNADIMMYKGTLKKEKIQQVREDIINILAEHDLNYGEARMILENFESFLEEQTRILNVSSK
ncbi:Uncharacterized protein BWINRASL_03518 [Bacillus mycoides]|nr:Uncharacterized protein BWINRASL_03518 [Bacillus mycoides]